MNEFKCGDEVWFYRDVFPIFSVEDIFPRRGTILDIDKDRTLIKIQHGDLFFWTNARTAFQSKQEAIDALIKHLEKIKNE